MNPSSIHIGAMRPLIAHILQSINCDVCSSSWKLAYEPWTYINYQDSFLLESTWLMRESFIRIKGDAFCYICLKFFSQLVSFLLMAGLISHRVLYILSIVCSLLWLIQAAERPPRMDANDKHDLFFHRFKQSRKSIDSNLDQVPQSLSPSNAQERSVILPRLCYFARVSGTSVHHKLCLPYNDR